MKLLRHFSEFNLYAGSKVLTFLSSVCVNALVSRSLGAKYFGLLMSASVIGFILSATVDGNVIARGISKWHDDRSSFGQWLINAIFLRFIFGILCFLILLSVCHFNQWNEYFVISTGWCILLILQPIRLLEIELIASQNFKLLAKASFWTFCLLLAIAVALFWIGWMKSVWISLILIVLPMLGAGPCLLFLRRFFQEEFKHLKIVFSKQEALDTFSFTPTQGLSMLLDRLPFVVIPAHFGQAMAGLYAVALTYIQPYTQAVVLLIPYTLTKLRTNKHWPLSKIFLFALAFGFFSVFAFLALGKPIITIINGAAFTDAGNFYLPLAGLILAIPAGQLCMGLAGLFLKPRLPFIAVTSAIILLVLGWFLLKPESIKGFLYIYSSSILLATIWQSFRLIRDHKHRNSIP